MKRVLLVAYHYPPIEAGAERVCRISGYLPAFGYRPSVLTTSAFGEAEGITASRAWEPLTLYRLLFNRGQREAPYARTGGCFWQGFMGWVRRNLQIPDAQMGWIPHAIAQGLRCIRREGITLIFTTYPPASSHLIGLALKRITGLPWVADFRDCWTYDPLDSALEGHRLQVERELEAWVVRGADRISVVTGVARESFVERYPESASKLVLIPNGFEPGSVGVARMERRGNERLRMVHTGTFSRSHPRRNPEALFEALRGMDRPPDLYLAGALTEEERQKAEDLVVRGIVHLKGSLSREKAAHHRDRADLLVLVDHPRRIRASNIPSKFYEYAATGRPILALTPAGAVRDLMMQLGAGRVADPDDLKAIREAIVAFMDEWGQTGELRSGVTAESIAPFRWEKLAERMAEVFEDTITS